MTEDRAQELSELVYKWVWELLEAEPKVDAQERGRIATYTGNTFLERARDNLVREDYHHDESND